MSTNNKTPKGGMVDTVNGIVDIFVEGFGPGEQEKFYKAAEAIATELVKKRAKGATDKAVLEQLRTEALREAMIKLASVYGAKLTQQPVFSWNSLGHKALQGVITIAVAAVGVGVAAYVTGGARTSESTPEAQPQETASSPFNTDFKASERPRRSA